MTDITNQVKNLNAYKVYIRAFSLIISLTLVLSVIAYLQGGSFHKFIDLKSREMGFSSKDPVRDAQAQAYAFKSRSFRICKTRIQSLAWPNHARIYEDKSGVKARWMAQINGAAEVRELDYLDIEKWFGINCVVKVTPLKAAANAPISKLVDFLVIQFVDGSTAHVKKASNAEFLFDGTYFKSTELAASLNELFRLGGVDFSKPR